MNLATAAVGLFLVHLRLLPWIYLPHELEDRPLLPYWQERLHQLVTNRRTFLDRERGKIVQHRALVHKQRKKHEEIEEDEEHVDGHQDRMELICLKTRSFSCFNRLIRFTRYYGLRCTTPLLKRYHSSAYYLDRHDEDAEERAARRYSLDEWYHLSTREPARFILSSDSSFPRLKCRNILRISKHWTQRVRQAWDSFARKQRHEYWIGKWRVARILQKPFRTTSTTEKVLFSGPWIYGKHGNTKFRRYRDVVATIWNDIGWMPHGKGIISNPYWYSTLLMHIDDEEDTTRHHIIAQIETTMHRGQLHSGGVIRAQLVDAKACESCRKGHRFIYLCDHWNADTQVIERCAGPVYEGPVDSLLAENEDDDDDDDEDAHSKMDKDPSAKMSYYGGRLTYEGPGVYLLTFDPSQACGSYTVTDHRTSDVYHGHLKFGKRNGFGTLQHSNYRSRAYVTTYTGEWRRDVRHGVGTFRCEHGEEYTGEWRNDLRHGVGREVLPLRGAVYEGEYQHGVFSGMGRWTYEGAQYQGQFVNGLRHDEMGKFTNSRTGERYTGGFRCDQRHGWGSWVCPRGSVNLLTGSLFIIIY